MKTLLHSRQLKYFWLPAFLILSLGTLLRLINLNSLPVFADESIYVRWAQVMQAEPSLRFLPQTDGKQPLFMWVLMVWQKLFTDPLLAGRSLSAISGIFTTIGIGVAGYLLFNNRRLAFYAAFLWVVVPFSVFFDRMALVDSFLVMFYLWGFIFTLLTIRRGRLDLAMIAGYCFGFAWLTKSTAIFGLVLLPSILLVSKKINIKLLGLILVIYLIAYSMYNILRLGPEFHMIAIRNRDYLRPFSQLILHPLDPLVPHLKGAASFWLYLVTPLGLLLGLLGLSDSHFAHRRIRLILASWWLIPTVIVAGTAQVLTARYLLFTIPFLIILVAHGIWHFGDKTKKFILASSTLGILATLCITLDLILIFRPSSLPLPRIERAGYLEEWTSGYGIRDIAMQIRQYARSGPVLVGSEGFFGTPFSALEMYLNQIPNVRITGVGNYADSAPEKLITALTDNRVFLVINSSRFTGAIDQPHLKLLASYPKAIPPENPREYLLFFEIVPE